MVDESILKHINVTDLSHCCCDEDCLDPMTNRQSHLHNNSQNALDTHGNQESNRVILNSSVEHNANNLGEIMDTSSIQTLDLRKYTSTTQALNEESNEIEKVKIAKSKN